MTARRCFMARVSLSVLTLVAQLSAEAATINASGQDLPVSAKATFTKSCQCGKKLSGQRIVGGHQTDISEYPWQAALADPSGYQFCGGSLITDRHVITAAHCVTGRQPSDTLVLLREHDLQQPSETSLVTKEVTVIRSHPLYNPATFLNDIAVLSLQSPVHVSPSLLPVCLPSNTKVTYAGRIATVTGWGALSSGGFSTNVLREVEVPVLSPKACQTETLYKSSEIYSRMICAGAKGIDSCQGDSGGPLVVKDGSNSYDLIGVVSWGNGCADEGYPGVYTRVNNYLPWIKNRTRTGIYCSGFGFPPAK